MNEYNLTKEQIEEFKAHLLRNERSPATVEKYLRDITAFSDWNGEQVTKERVIEYKNHLQESEYAVRSINSMLAALNSLFDYLGWQELRVKTMKIQHQAFCPAENELTREEYERLCRTAEQQNRTRLLLILQTICGTGMRVSELRYITVEAVRCGRAVVSLKGKTRTIFLVKSLQKKLMAYIRLRGISSGQIFLTRNGLPVSRTEIWREMKSLCTAAGVSPGKVYPHNLRHLFARIFYSLDKDLAKLADLLGHSNIDTTRIYILSSGQEHRRRLERMHLVI